MTLDRQARRVCKQFAGWARGRNGLDVKLRWYLLTFLGFVCSSGVVVAPIWATQQPVSDTIRAEPRDSALLDPIRITVTRTTQPMTGVPYAVTVLDRRDAVRGRLTAGLDEALVGIPGVLVANRHNYAQDQQLSIRGFGARSAFGVRGLKVLLDGIPQTLPDGQGQLTNVDLAEIETIEVLRTSASTLYGNASGGVVSLWSEATRPDRTEPRAHMVGGAYGLKKWRAGVVAPAGNGYVSASVARTTLDGFRRHSRADTRRLSIRVGQAVGSRTQLIVRAQVADQPLLQDPGGLNAAEADSAPAAPNPRNLSSDAGKDVTQSQAGVTLQHALPAGRVAVTLFGLRRTLANQLSFAFIDLDRWAYGARASATLAGPPRLGSSLLTAGFDLQRQRDDRRNFDPGRVAETRSQVERVTEVGPFLQATVQPVPPLTLTVGARVDLVSFQASDRLLGDGDDSGKRTMSAVSGTAGLAWRLHVAAEPYASVGTSFETPTTTELANRPQGGGGFNPGLNAQSATTVEVGLRGRVGEALHYGVSAFRAAVRDELIPFEVPGEPGRRFFRNAGSSTHSGVEIGIGGGPLPGVSFRVAYTLARHRFESFRTALDIFDGNTIPGVPEHYLHMTGRFEAPPRLWMAVDVTHSSSSYLDDANSTRNNGWVTTGIRFGWDGHLAGWAFSPFAGVHNLFDETYVGAVRVNAGFGRYFEPAPGRNVYLGLEIGGGP